MLLNSWSFYEEINDDVFLFMLNAMQGNMITHITIHSMKRKCDTMTNIKLAEDRKRRRVTTNRLASILASKPYSDDKSLNFFTFPLLRLAFVDGKKQHWVSCDVYAIFE